MKGRHVLQAVLSASYISADLRYKKKPGPRRSGPAFAEFQATTAPLL